MLKWFFIQLIIIKYICTLLSEPSLTVQPTHLAYWIIINYQEKGPLIIIRSVSYPGTQNYAYKKKCIWEKILEKLETESEDR